MSVYSLSIIEATRESVTLASTQGPFLFESEQGAKDRLFTYVKNRMLKDWASYYANNEILNNIVSFTRGDVDPIELGDALGTILNALTDTQKARVVTWFFKIANDELILAEYKIEFVITAA